MFVMGRWYSFKLIAGPWIESIHNLTEVDFVIIVQRIVMNIASFRNRWFTPLIITNYYHSLLMFWPSSERERCVLFVYLYVISRDRERVRGTFVCEWTHRPGPSEEGDRLRVGKGGVPPGQRSSGQPGFGRDLCSNSNLPTELPHCVLLSVRVCVCILVWVATMGV